MELGPNAFQEVSTQAVDIDHFLIWQRDRLPGDNFRVNDDGSLTRCPNSFQAIIDELERLRTINSHLLTTLRVHGIEQEPIEASDLVLGQIGAERRRQIVAEGYDAAHDDGHPGEMARAAAAYAEIASGTSQYKDGLWEPLPDGRVYGVAAPEVWPWSFEAWKPKNPRRDLIRSAALIIAEVECLDRAAKSASEA